MNRRKMIVASLISAGVTLSHRAFAWIKPAEPKRRNVTEFGATGDGIALNTHAIQRAIDAVSQAGGGVLEVPPGNFVTGTLQLKSGVALHLAQGAVLLGSLNPDDYRAEDPFLDAVDVMRGYALLVAVDAKRVAITGEGAIDGRGVELQRLNGGSRPDAKPFLVRWVRCASVRVSGVTLKSAAAWTMHAFQSSDLDYQNVRVSSFGVENNDGFDIDSCERVRIDSCLVESQDDAICVKTTSVHPCRDVKVTNCTVRTHHGALKIGTESMGDIEDIEFRSCHVVDAREGAVKFCSEDGANVRRILVSELVVEIADTPIFLRLGTRMRKYRKDDPTLPVGSISGLRFENIHVADSTRVGILISGVPGHAVRDTSFSSVYIKLKGEINAPSEGEIVLPEQVASYPEVWMFGPLIPAYGACVRHAEGVRLLNVELKVELPDRRPAVVCEDVRELSLRDIQLTGAPNPEWVVTLRNASGIRLDRISTHTSAKTFLRVQGVGCNDIRLRAPGPAAQQAFDLEDGAPSTSVQVDPAPLTVGRGNTPHL